MNIKTASTTKPKNIATVDDGVVPFHVEELNIRGRVVKLDSMLNAILDSHQYPELVSGLLAKNITLGVLLGSSLKFDGRLIIQIQSDGAISLMVVEFSSPNKIRSYAYFDQDKLDALIENSEIDHNDSASLLGNGSMAITIDYQDNNTLSKGKFGTKSQQYQGIVAIDGLSIEGVIHHYFNQSEQIPTMVKLSTKKTTLTDEYGKVTTSWKAGGIIAQSLPSAEENINAEDVSTSAPVNDLVDSKIGSQEDDWHEAQAFLATIQDDELINPQISAEQLLYRLFHQQGVRVYPATQMINKCRCSKQKIIAIISNLTAKERAVSFAGSDKPNMIDTKCEFCGTTYQVSADEIDNEINN